MYTRPPEWPKSGWYWHLHHDALIEWTDDIDERWDYVVHNKPENELPTRLRLMGPVIGDLPAEVIAAQVNAHAARAKWNAALLKQEKAGAEEMLANKARVAIQIKLDVTNKELDEAASKQTAAHNNWIVAHTEQEAVLEKYHAANRNLDTALYSNMAAIEALHAAECQNCPWDGQSIFPKGVNE